MCNNFHPNLRGGYATQGVICVQKHEDLLHRFSKFKTQFIKGSVQLLIFLLASDNCSLFLDPFKGGVIEGRGLI